MVTCTQPLDSEVAWQKANGDEKCATRSAWSLRQLINVPEHVRVVIRKNVEFYEDKGLDQRFRNRLSDFKESGYDRGHMVRSMQPLSVKSARWSEAESVCCNCNCDA